MAADHWQKPNESLPARKSRGVSADSESAFLHTVPNDTRGNGGAAASPAQTSF